MARSLLIIIVLVGMAGGFTGSARAQSFPPVAGRVAPVAAATAPAQAAPAPRVQTPVGTPVRPKALAPAEAKKSNRRRNLIIGGVATATTVVLWLALRSSKPAGGFGGGFPTPVC